VIVTGSSWSHLPVLLALILLAAGTGAVLRGIRFLRRRPQPLATPSVRAVPHADPAGTVTVRDSGTDLTHTARIEPHPDAAVTTIEETRP
jgi:hypothetical protein